MLHSLRQTWWLLVATLEAAIFVLLWFLPIVWLAGHLEFSVHGIDISITWGPRVWLVYGVVGSLWWWTRRRVRPRSTPALPFDRLLVRKMLLAPTVTFLCLLVLEGLLALIGAGTPLPPLIIRGAEYRDEDDSPFMADRDLLYRFRPGITFRGQRINTLGFPDREVTCDKPPGTVRVVCMGDSCTAEGPPTYATLLQERLTAAPPSVMCWEAFHNGVHGYTVVQGFALFGTTTKHLQPDIVTLYYGWNGHWAADATDRVRIMSMRKSVRLQLLQGIRSKHMAQLLAQIMCKRAAGDSTDACRRKLRVPPEDYRRTLIDLVKAIRSAHAIPILLTAPRAEHMHAVLAERSHTSIEEIHARHDHYADLTRRVARDTGTPLVDLAAQFADDPDRNLYFLRDGIHLTVAGRQKVADRLYSAIVSLPR